MIKLLIGGSPCTKWSIAQKNGREIEPSGIGWELFENYNIAKKKFQPDFFLYENNKSAAQPIKDQISHELGVDLMHINSALVSAQNRQRFYAFNWKVAQPQDRGILLRDILEPVCDEITYEMQSVGVGYRNRRENDGKLYRRFETHGEEKANALTTVLTDSMVAEPIRIGDIGSTAQAHRVYSCCGKSVTINAGGGGQGGKTGLYLCPAGPGRATEHLYQVRDGLITIKRIARIPGERAKVAVESYDDRIDPVGACVGMKGSRIYTIVKELRNENIDVVNYATNPQLMIQRSLNPAKISTITIDEERKTASVYLQPEEVSLAIGKGGLNIRLSKLLTGYDIDVYREIEEEDVALTEFSDEIEGWIIEALKSAGCDTAKSVLELSVEEIAQRADLEVEQAAEVVAILKAEFE